MTSTEPEADQFFTYSLPVASRALKKKAFSGAPAAIAITPLFGGLVAPTGRTPEPVGLASAMRPMIARALAGTVLPVTVAPPIW